MSSQDLVLKRGREREPVRERFKPRPELARTTTLKRIEL